MLLRPARLAISAAFLVQGLLFISLTTRLPLVADAHDLDELELSGLMLLMVLMAGLGSVGAEALARRLGSANGLRIALVVVAIGFAVIGDAVGGPGPFGALVAGLAVYGVGLGAVDAASNMQAVALEHLAERPLLPSFHACWTGGGIVATLLTLATGDTIESGWAGPWLLTAVAVAAAFLPLLGREPVEPAEAAGHDAPDVALPWRSIVLVGLALIVFYMVDTATTAWGPLYLASDAVFASPAESASLFALATLPYLVATLAARLVGDGLTARFGPTAVVRSGALVAFAGLLVVVLAPASTWQVAILGFFVVGLGVAVIAPLAFSAAARIAGDASDPDDDPVTRRARVDATIARFNQFNYVGALLGAVLTGAAGSGNLRIGYAVPLVLVLALVPLARHFAGPDRSRAGSGEKSLAPGATAP